MSNPVCLIVGADDSIGATTAKRFAKGGFTICPLETVSSNVCGNINSPIFETPERVFYRVWQMACFAGFFAGRVAARHIMPRERGSIFTGATASLREASGHAAFSRAKFGLRALAQAMKRELRPRGLPVAHLIIDSGGDTAFVRDRIKERGINPDESPQDTLMSPDSVGKVYWNSHHQTRDAWTHGMDIRPFTENLKH